MGKVGTGNCFKRSWVEVQVVRCPEIPGSCAIVSGWSQMEC